MVCGSERKIFVRNKRENWFGGDSEALVQGSIRYVVCEHITISFMSKVSVLLLTAVLLSACSQTTPGNPDEEKVGNDQVIVDFLSQAEALSAEDIVSRNKDYYLEQEPEYMKEATKDEDYLSSLTQDEKLLFWKVGTIQNGDYANQSLVLARAACDGPCAALFFRYALDVNTDHWTLLVPYSDGTENSLPAGPASDQEASIGIASLTAPQALDLYANDPVVIADPFNNQDPSYFGMEGQEDFSRLYQPLTDITDTAFTKYFTTLSNGCIYGETPDGILVRYQVMPVSFNFLPGAKGNTMPEPITTADMTLTLTDGTTESHTYAVTAGGCGFIGNCILTYTANAGDEANLKELGSIKSNDGPSEESNTVYTLGKLTASPAADSVTQAVSQAYDNYKMNLIYRDPPEIAMSISEFLTQYKIVLIKLDNGDFALAYDSEVAPVAECGKPVIYLYPTTPEQVSVQVNNVEFTKTIPAYGNGWTVWAETSGVLTNLADGLKYPYLFWEGNSYANIPTNEGWTLAKKDVATRLPLALTDMGLSAQEAADFMEFWLPKLQNVATPYIQFNFEGTAAMNQVAPLTITPAPDMLLRVFMVYQGVSHPGHVMPHYTAPDRHGFTVIEWGGTLY